MKSGTFYEKYVKSIENIWKATKTADSIQVSHFDLVFHRVQREGQLGICYILVIFGGICIHTYWPALVCFHEKWHFFMKSTWKATKTSDSTQISHFDLVFHRVQREGQLGICYILVIFGGICIHTYWPALVCFHEKWHFFMKSTWKATKTSDSTQISHFDLVFHRVQREGQLGISYFGSIWWCMYV